MDQLSINVLFGMLLLAVNIVNMSERYGVLASVDFQVLNTNSSDRMTRGGVPIISEAYPKSWITNYTRKPSNPLSLYEDFVNDPWKPTQSLETLLAGKRRETSGVYRPEVRLGYLRREDELPSPRRESNAWHEPNLELQSVGLALPMSSTIELSSRIEQDGDWIVSSRSEDHITYKRMKSSLSNGPTTETSIWMRRDGESSPYDNPDWIMHSRSDGHVTYQRRRLSDRENGFGDSQIHRLGQKDHEVLARVVHTGYDGMDNTRREIESNNNLGLPSLLNNNNHNNQRWWTDSVNRQEQKGRLELKSQNQERHAWDKESIGSIGSIPKQSTNYLSSFDTIPRRSIEERISEPSTTNNYVMRIESRIDSHKYPILNERGLAERASRIGTSNRLALVY